MYAFSWISKILQSNNPLKFQFWKIVGRFRKFFCAFWVPQSPIGLISTEIEARCRIPGHATLPLPGIRFSQLLIQPLGRATSQ